MPEAGFDAGRAAQAETMQKAAQAAAEEAASKATAKAEAADLAWETLSPLYREMHSKLKGTGVAVVYRFNQVDIGLVEEGEYSLLFEPYLTVSSNETKQFRLHLWSRPKRLWLCDGEDPTIEKLVGNVGHDEVMYMIGRMYECVRPFLAGHSRQRYVERAKAFIEKEGATRKTFAQSDNSKGYVIGIWSIAIVALVAAAFLASG